MALAVRSADVCLGGVAAWPFADGQYERAIECALVLRENRTYTHAYRLLVRPLCWPGGKKPALSPAILALEPGLTVAGFRRRYPGSASPQAELFCGALARAGVPSLDLSGPAPVRP